MTVLKDSYALPLFIDIYFDLTDYDALASRWIFCQASHVFCHAIDRNQVIWWWSDKEETWLLLEQDLAAILFAQWRAFLDASPGLAQVINVLSRPLALERYEDCMSEFFELVRLLKDRWAQIAGLPAEDYRLAACSPANVYSDLAKGYWALPTLAVAPYNEKLHGQMQSIEQLSAQS